MPTNPQEFADLLGAAIIGEVPDVDGGPFGMAQLAHVMHQQLTPSQGERPGRPTNSNWSNRPKVPMSAETQQRLADIAEKISTSDRRVSPMQVAAHLLEEVVAVVTVKAGAHVEQLPDAHDLTDKKRRPKAKKNHRGAKVAQRRKRV